MSDEIRVHLDTLEYTRQGLRTRSPIDVATSRNNRVVLVRPNLAHVQLTAQHGFALDRAFPLPATLALLASYRRPTSPLPPYEVAPGPKGTLQIFGHADASGDEAHNKTLSERRAAVVHALFDSDVDSMLGLASEDGWTPWEYQVLLRVLGSDPGPTDGDPGQLTDLAVAHFAQRYRSGFFHAEQAPRIPDLHGEAFDGPTVQALLDAFVHAFAPNLQGCTLHPLRPTVGCSEFNLIVSGGGSQNRRVSLLTSLDDPHPENAPCTQGDPAACAVVGDGPYDCMWYREHVHLERAQDAALYDPRWLTHPDGSYILSVLTNLPDDAPVSFEVFGHEQPMPTASPWVELPLRYSDPLTTTSVGGVATTTWTPPPSLEPDAPDGPLPVFRVVTEGLSAHAWANQADVIGVQLLDSQGRCFSHIDLTLATPSGSHQLTTNASGVAWLREPTDGPVTATLPTDLLLPHPSETTLVDQPRSVADLDASRGGTHELSAGRVTRLRVQPLEAAPGYASCHFDEGLAYPADTLLALVQQARNAVETTPDARIALFAHTRPSSSVDNDKALSDRRAAFVHAVLTADLSALEAVVDQDAWDETHYISLAHFLGYESDDPHSLFASFQWGYSAGAHHAEDLGLGDGKVEATGALDEPTKHALLDAYLATVGASLPPDAFAPTPCAGCAGFNAPPAGDHPDRLTLVMFPPGRAPTSVPCLVGDAAACHVEADDGCRFFVEQVQETSLKYRWVDGAVADDEDLLYAGGRVLVHQSQRVAGAVYRVPPTVEDVVYAFAPPAQAPPPVVGSVSPRVHRTKPTDAIRKGLLKSRSVRLDAVPDGEHILPMEWADDGRTIKELLFDYWAVALRQIARKKPDLSRADVEQYRLSLDVALPQGTAPAIPDGPAFEDYRALGDAKFLQFFLVAGMVAGGQVLNPRLSQRYAADPDNFRFSCNAFATDLVALLPQGAWIPKVQFAHPRAVQADPSKAQTERLTDVGPSGINDFLVARLHTGGSDYGWKRLPADTSTHSGRREARKAAQALANQGTLVLLSAATKKKSGHIAVVMPDLAFLTTTEKRNMAHAQAVTSGGNRLHFPWGFDGNEFSKKRHAPFRSQAGGFNGHGIRSGVLLLRDDPDLFRNPGYFAYDPTQDKSRGTDVER